MNWNPNSNEAGEGMRHEAEETLRQLAALAPPEDLTDRVHARLRAAQLATPRRGFWGYWMPAQRLQFAGAAALALVVAGSAWTIYHRHPQGDAAKQTVQPVVAPAPTDAGFSTAAGERVPPTLKPIKVPPAPHRKPGAGHSAAKAAPKPVVAAAATPNP
jgi:hypothetical protein